MLAITVPEPEAIWKLADGLYAGEERRVRARQDQRVVGIEDAVVEAVGADHRDGEIIPRLHRLMTSGGR